MAQVHQHATEDPEQEQNGASDAQLTMGRPTGQADQPTGQPVGAKTPEPLAQTAEAVQAAGDRVAREQYPHEQVKRRAWGWAVAWVVILLLVAGLAYAAHTTRVLPGDLAVTRALQSVNSPVVFDVLYAVSYIGYTIPFAIIMIVVWVILALLRLWVELLFSVLTLLSLAVEVLAKALVARPRPSATLVHVTTHLTDYSFPSGHVLHYTIFYGFLAFMLATVFRPSWGRNLLMAICIALIILVGVSRVYLGEHWATDVIGGYLIGALFLGPFCWAYIWARGRVIARKRARAGAATPRASSAPGDSATTAPAARS